MPDENIFEKAFREQREAWAELDALRAENERLRALITAWADAEDAEGGYSIPISAERLNASKLLRKAVER